MSRLLPSGFYISAGLEEDEKGNLFRPKQLTHFIIPNLGMVMNPPFWVKYVLFLRKHGFELDKREGESDIDFRVRCTRLFFEVPLPAFNGEKRYDYSIFSILMRAMRESPSTFENIITGRDWCSKRPKGWLFANNNWPNTVDCLINVSINNERENKGKNDENRRRNGVLSFANKLFGNTFKHRTVEKQGLSFEEIIEEKLVRNVLALYKENGRRTSAEDKLYCVLRHICKLISEVYSADDKLFRYIMRHKGPLLEPIIVFVRENLLCEDDRNQKYLDKLANCNYMVGEYGISRDEGIAFLKALYMNEKGRWIVISLVLRDFLERIKGGIDRLKTYERRRELYRGAFEKLEDRWEEFKKFVSYRWSFLDVDERFFDDVKFSSVVWEFNYFLHSGERVIRRMLNRLDQNKRISVDTLKNFEEQDKGRQWIGEDFDFMKSFLESLRANAEKRGYLLRLIKLYQEKERKDSRLMKFLKELLDILRAKRFDFYNAYLRLLEIGARDTDKKFSDPAFAGEGTFNDWYYVFRSVVFED